MNRNLVTNKNLTPQVLEALRTSTVTGASSPLVLTPYDPPYFFVRIDGQRRLRDQVFASGPFAEQRVEGWRQISVESQDIRDELEFLRGIGLAMSIPYSSGAYAVSPVAIRQLYDETDGMFINIIENREHKSRQFIKLLITYVLPGMFWRNYYVTEGLAPSLHLTTQLGEEMLEIGELWDRLVATVGFPTA